MALFFIFFFPILLYLGAWQVQRGIEKNAMWDLHDLNKSLPPMEETEMSLLAKEKRDYRNITLTGKYLPKTYFLDNRIYRQTAGYEVFSAFKSDSQQLFLINRGWVSKEEAGENSFDTGTEKTVFIQGLYTPFKRFGLSLSNYFQTYEWPKVVQELDYEQASLDMGNETLHEAVIQLSAGSVGALEPVWSPTSFKPSRHYGYAVQWWGLALVLVTSFIYFGFKRGSNENI